MNIQRSNTHSSDQLVLLPTPLSRASRTRKPLSQQTQPTFLGSWKAFAFSSWLNVLLVFVPLGFLAHYLKWNGIVIFVLNFFAIVPLAKLLGYATEELSMRFGETIGGLLNATFGNAVELILSIVALKEGLLRVVQASLLGSILSNLLLVLGMCFFFGGLKYKQQHFNEVAAQTSASLLALSVISLLIPAAFNASIDKPEDAKSGILNLSHGTAIILLVIYGLFLLFQLRTHADLYEESGGNNAEERHHIPSDADDIPITDLRMEAAREELDEEDGPSMSMLAAFIALIIVTVIVAFHAEFLVSSIEAVTKGGQLSEVFVGIILLPIVGNAAEHVTAISVAMKNKMDLAIGVAVGSSTQIALLVTPLLVVIGWIIGQPLTLFFETFETAVLFITVLITNYLIQDGKSNWLEGAMLIGTYVIIAIAFFYLPKESK